MGAIQKLTKRIKMVIRENRPFSSVGKTEMDADSLEFCIANPSFHVHTSTINSIPRPELIQLLGDGLERCPIVTILGPRQCGKTTLAREFCKGRRDVVFLDLENPADAARLAEPMLYLERLSGLVVLDEVQTMPAVLSVLRVLADRRPLPLRFLLLGSASPELMDKASESLAGRVEFLEMGGFGLREAKGDQDRLW